MTFKYFNVKNGLTTGNITLNASNSNVTASTFVGNLLVAATANLGGNGNVIITGGSSGQYLQTDGNGNLSFSSVTTTPGGSNTQIQFNDTGSLSGNAGLTFNKTNTTLTANNIVATSTANLGAVGNITITGGSNGQVLTTNGSGVLSWSTITAGNITIDKFTGNGVATNFTLTVTPASEDYTIINIDGVVQLHNAYSLASNVVTMSSAPANGSEIEVTTVNMGSGGGGGGGGITAQDLLSPFLLMGA